MSQTFRSGVEGLFDSLCATSRQATCTKCGSEVLRVNAHFSRQVAKASRQEMVRASS